jgi:hypothetical protein
MTKAIIIVCVSLIAIFGIYQLYRSYTIKQTNLKVEQFIQELFTITNQIPNVKCKTSLLQDLSTDDEVQKLIATDTVHPSLVESYAKALKAYKEGLAKYNALPFCKDYCIGGTTDVHGDCICPPEKPIPFLYNGTIYCVKDDLSKIPNSSFDVQTASFKCSPGFERDTKTNNCYSVADGDRMKTYTQNLINSLASVTKSPTSILRSYGSLVLKTPSGDQVNYYITPQASLSTDGLTVVPVPATYATPIECTADCATAAANLSASVFSWNPRTKVCTLYAGKPVSISNLDDGILTVGSTLLQ